MTEAVKKFKEALEKIDTVSIKTGKSNDLTKILAASLLHNLFIRLGKKSSVENWDSSPAFSAYLESLFEKKFIKDNPKDSEHILIKLDTTKIPVSELNYEKVGDTLKIILKGTNNLNHEGIIIEKERDPVDMLILLDPPARAVDELLEKNPHKDVVKITARDRGLSNKISDIIFAFYDEMPSELKEPLWLLINEENKELSSPKAESFGLLQKLSLMTINLKKITSAEEDFFGADYLKLLGRALSRSEFEKELKTVWTFMPQSDIQKTGMRPEWLLSIFREIRNMRKGVKFSALLWEDIKEGSRTVSAIVGGEENDGLTELAASLGTAPASNYFILSGFKAFSEAEVKIRLSLRKFSAAGTNPQNKTEN